MASDWIIDSSFRMGYMGLVKEKIMQEKTKLKEQREKAGLSQSQLAAAADISVRVLQNYEQAIRDLDGAKLITLLKLCSALDCTLADLVTNEEILRLLKEQNLNR